MGLDVQPIEAQRTPSRTIDIEVSAARVGYERLSSDRALRGISVAIQHAEIDDHAEETGEPVTRHYQDNDTSASEFGTKPRTDYLKLLAAVHRSEVREIIVTEVARLCRQVEEGLDLIRLSKITPLRYIRTTDGMVYDLATPRGRKSFRDAVSDAQFESDQTSSRQHRRKNKQAEAGMHHGGERPYGYEGALYEEFETETGEKVRGPLLNPGRVGRVIIPSEAAVRRECTRRIISGETLTDVTRDLNRRGILTAHGAKWRVSNLSRMLLNKRAVAFDQFPGKGTRVHKSREYRATWDAIISKEEYELMKAALKLHGNPRGRGRTAGRTYLLSGILHCGKCGHAMYGNSRTLRSGNRQHRYICRQIDEYGNDTGCSGVYRGAEPVDLLVTEAVLYRFDSPQTAAALAPKEDQTRITELVEQHQQQQARLTSLAADYGSGFFKTKKEYEIARDAAQAGLDQIEAQLGKLQTSQVVSAIPVDQTLRDAWEHASLDWKRSLILLLVDYVVIEPGHPGNKRWNGWQFDPDKVTIKWRV